MKTILYYTANRENPEFEKKIQETLLENCGNLPIISVSQKPISLGKNICVGDVGHSYLNEFRQILIGAKKAKTDYLVMAEADFLYPKEYFSFEPSGENLYRYSNVWIIFKNGVSRTYRLESSNGAQICRREYIIDTIEKYLEGQPEWIDGKYAIRDAAGIKPDFNIAPFERFGEMPCVSFKTGFGITSRCHYLAGDENKAGTLPYWGNIQEIRRKYLW